MPKKQATPCGHRGCSKLSKEHYCEEHRRHYTRLEVSGRREQIKIYNTARWRKLRMMQLRRYPICAQCGGAANTVDHKIPIEQGGDVWDFKNLQTLCFECHQLKRAKEAHMTAKGQTYNDISQITLICGPPGAGKTSYVKERARHGDLILDLDRIFVALSGLPKYDKPTNLFHYAMTAYDSIVMALSRESESYQHSWVITSAARKKKRQQLQSLLNAKMVMLDVDPAECLRRISKDPNRSARLEFWKDIVKNWWDDYELDEKENSYA